MTSKPTLYGWMSRIGNIPIKFDHTFVTDFKPLQPMSSTGSQYWYCFGAYHEQATEGATGSSLASTATILEKIASDGVGEGTKSLANWWIDGKCHQCANQILYCIESDPPQTMTNARGIWLSTFFFGTYGLRVDEWKLAAENIRSGNADYDMFHERVEHLLKYHPVERAAVKCIRKLAQDITIALRPLVPGAGTDAPPAIEALLLATSAMSLHAVHAAIGLIHFIKLFDLGSLLEEEDDTLAEKFRNGTLDIDAVIKDLSAGLHAMVGEYK